jgi:hypothetical protein
VTIARNLLNTAMPSEEARQKRRNMSVNWGKRYPSGRGTVEYINVSLKIPHDFTIYLGDPAVMPFWNDRPFLLSIGNGGTSSNVEIVGSIRGTIVHVVCQDLIVRGDTQPTEAVPADSGFRYQAHCGLGRPSAFTIGGSSIHADAPGAVVFFPVSAYATLLSFELAGTPALYADTTVAQIERTPSGDVVVVPFDGIAAEDPISTWATPHALDPRTNVLRVTIGAAAAFPGFDLALRQEITL